MKTGDGNSNTMRGKEGEKRSHQVRETDVEVKPGRLNPYRHLDNVLREASRCQGLPSTVEYKGLNEAARDRRGQV